MLRWPTAVVERLLADPRAKLTATPLLHKRKSLFAAAAARRDGDTMALLVCEARHRGLTPAAVGRELLMGLHEPVARFEFYGERKATLKEGMASISVLHACTAAMHFQGSCELPVIAAPPRRCLEVERSCLDAQAACSGGTCSGL